MDNKVSLETRFDNRLSNFGLRNLSVLEQNLWWSLAKLIKDKGTKELTFSRAEICQVLGYNSRQLRGNDFMRSMNKMGHKIVSINTEMYDEANNRCIIFSLFPVFEVDPKQITVQVSKYFSPWFNDIQKNFTRIDLSVLIGFKSGYSKELYRFLMRWKNLRPKLKHSGFWSVPIGEFRRLMCIPDSYNMSDIKRYIINPAINDFTSVNNEGWSPLSHFEVNLVKEKGAKKKVERIEFTFSQGTPSKLVINDAEARVEELLPIGFDSKTKTIDYKNNFTNGYIPGENSPVKGFELWLSAINLFVDNKEYFGMRTSARKDLITLYKQRVTDDDNEYWTDMRFFASIYRVIQNDKPMTKWSLEEAYSEIRRGKRLHIPQEIYNSLPEDKINELFEFTTNGKVIL